MNQLLPPYTRVDTKIMIFVDGENLTIRYGRMLADRTVPSHVTFEPNVYVWTRYMSLQSSHVVRRHYYTSSPGDEQRRTQIEDQLKSHGIEAPRVFARTKQKGSKRVDISLATDMLTHAHRKNYELAVLVAGDEDYVPLVEAVMAEGRRVVLWFLEDGLSPMLKRKVDHYFDIGKMLFETNKAALASLTR